MTGNSAMPVSPPAAITEEEAQLVLGFAKALVDRRLAVPATFLLEGLRPLNFVMSQGVAFLSPVVKIIHDQSRIDLIQDLLEKREAIPYILKVIQQLEEARRG
jgi:hypothetical protein